MTGEVRRLDYCDQGLADDPDGDFVLYSDYAAVLAKYEAVERDAARFRYLVTNEFSFLHFPDGRTFATVEIQVGTHMAESGRIAAAIDRAMQDDGGKP